MKKIFDRILEARGMTSETARAAFLSPDYAATHDPFLLPDMAAAVERLVGAHEHQERITIYGDYDIDGLTATTVLLDALRSFGFTQVETFIPNRFVEGYGLTKDAVEKVAREGHGGKGTQLMITVDCGSLSHQEIEHAQQLGMDVIVTDHHNVAATPPPAVATINPKRTDHQYPFIDLAGVGVAFKLVQALQTRLSGLEDGQEKWLLDLVALGTVCDVVTLVNENRLFVYWGLKVLAKTRRPGLKALMAVAGVEPARVTARSLGFGLGPRMNAAGRLETAQYALDMLTTNDARLALEKAQQLDDLNRTRRAEQDRIFQEAIIQAEQYADDPVLVVSGAGWSHGIIGIVAAKLLERFQKPTFVLEEMGDEAKGSARSYGDFSAADAIRAADDIITKGGGHKLAAGVTLPTDRIEAFRRRLNDVYRSQKLTNQPALLLPTADTAAQLRELNEALVDTLSALEPYGHGNPQPVLKSESVVVLGKRVMGADNQHVKLTVRDSDGDGVVDLVAFQAPEHFFLEPGTRATVWYTVDINEWQGRRSVQGHLLHLEIG